MHKLLHSAYLFLLVCIFCFLFYGMVFGALLPFMKSVVFMDFFSSPQGITNARGFYDHYDRVFAFSSLVGDQEISLLIAYDVLELLQSTSLSYETARDLALYADAHLAYYSDFQTVLTRGHIYQTLWLVGRDARDYLEAERFFREALALGSKVPRVLYSLFFLYYEAHDAEKARDVGTTILRYWPYDQTVRHMISEMW